jgi:hypothetical protein
MKIKTAKYITVLDFEIGRVFQYKIGEKGWNPDQQEYHGSCEEFITNIGHRLKDCEWMVHEVAGVIKNELYFKI